MALARTQTRALFSTEAIDHVETHALRDGFLALCVRPQKCSLGFMLYFTAVVTPNRLHLIDEKLELGSLYLSAQKMTSEIIFSGSLEPVFRPRLSGAVSTSLHTFGEMLSDTRIGFKPALSAAISRRASGYFVGMQGEHPLRREPGKEHYWALARAWDFCREGTLGGQRSRGTMVFRDKFANILSRLLAA